MLAGRLLEASELLQYKSLPFLDLSSIGLEVVPLYIQLGGLARSPSEHCVVHRPMAKISSGCHSFLRIILKNVLFLHKNKLHSVAQQKRNCSKSKEYNSTTVAAVIYKFGRLNVQTMGEFCYGAISYEVSTLLDEFCSTAVPIP